MKCERKDCFAWTEGQANRCNALGDVCGGGTDCPFFKTIKQEDKELRKFPWNIDGKVRTSYRKRRESNE